MKDAVTLTLLLILCLVGAVGMLGEGMKASALVEQLERQKKVKEDALNR